MDLDRMLADPAFDLPVPPDGLSRVHDRARRIKRRRQVALALPCLALAVTGPMLLAGGRSGTPDVAAGPSPAPSLTLTQDVVRPVPGPAPDGVRARFAALGQPVPRIEEALAQLRGECMTAQSLPYEQYSGPRERDEAAALEPQYAVTEDQARQRGYGIAERRTRTGTQDPNAAYLATLSKTERDAWYLALDDVGDQLTERFDEPFLRGMDVIVGGCTRSALEQVYGDVRSYGVLDFVYNGTGLIMNFAAQDGELQALDERWSACMRLSGAGDYAGPQQAESAAGKEYQDNPATAPTREREIALADARCQTDVKYVAQRVAIEDRYLAGMAQQYPEVLERIERSMRTAGERAQAVLGDR